MVSTVDSSLIHAGLRAAAPPSAAHAGRLLGAHTATHCGDAGECLAAPNPGAGQQHFDSVGPAVLTLFQCVTLVAWDGVFMYAVQSSGEGSTLFFSLFVVVANCVIVNLSVGLVLCAFSDAYAGQKEEQQRRGGGGGGGGDHRDLDAAYHPGIDSRTRNSLLAAQAALHVLWLGQQRVWWSQLVLPFSERGCLVRILPC